jgi:hypothetical protein
MSTHDDVFYSVEFSFDHQYLRKKKRRLVQSLREKKENCKKTDY